MPVGTIWTPEEDERLAHLVNIHGPKKWSQIASDLGSKGSKQCRRRWKNFISLEERKQGSWTPEEDAMLLDGHRRHGNKWTLIAQEIGGRTDNAVKNRWAALEKKRRADEEPGELARRHVPVMQPQNDLLGVRRIICKDQPRYRAPHAAEAAWMEDQRHDDEQTQQLPYTLSPGLMMQQQIHQTEHHELNMSMPARKPDLMINIPCATAAEPELPYSQRTQANAVFAGQKGLQDMDLAPAQIHVEDESLLSTSRQAAQNAITALTSPSEEPGTISSLYKYLCSATPVDTQQQLPGGRRSPPPWVSSSCSRAMDAPQQQQQLPQAQPLLPPAPLLQSQLLPLQQQQALHAPAQLQQSQVSQYQQLTVTAGMMMPPQTQLPMIPLQSNSLQQQQQQQLPQSAPMQYLPQQQQHAPRLPVSSGMVPCQQQGGSFVESLVRSGCMPAVTAGMQAAHQTQHEQMLAPSLVVQQQQMLAPQMRYPPTSWQQQSYSSPPVTQAQGVQYVQPAMSSAVHTTYLPQNHQQQQPDDVQKQWGPEELRQLLELLGDQQQPGQQQQQVQGLLPASACLAGSTACLQLQGSMPGSTGMSPHVPEEEVDQVNNGHWRQMHAAPQAGLGLTGLDSGASSYELV